MNMQITEVKIYPTNEDLVRGYVTITFDNCIKIRDIKVIKSTTGLFVSMPTRKQRDGTNRGIAYPVNDETRATIKQAILTKYEKVVAESHPEGPNSFKNKRRYDEEKIR
jgi:stage V sporulation protein G